MKQYKWQNGANERIYDILTIGEDGSMGLTCHLTDRTLHYDGAVEQDGEWQGWLRYGHGSLMPVYDRRGQLRPCWQEVSDVEAVTEEMTAMTAADDPAAVSVLGDSVAEPAEPTEPTEPEQPADTPTPLPTTAANDDTDGMAALLTMYERQQQELEQLRQQNARLMAEREEQPTRRQRRQRRRATAQREQPSPVSTADTRRQSADINAADDENVQRSMFNVQWMKPLGLVAASVAACVVIYETGLLIPLGLIGLAAGGILK